MKLWEKSRPETHQKLLAMGKGWRMVVLQNLELELKHEHVDIHGHVLICKEMWIDILPTRDFQKHHCTGGGVVFASGEGGGCDENASKWCNATGHPFTSAIAPCVFRLASWHQGIHRWLSADGGRFYMKIMYMMRAIEPTAEPIYLCYLWVYLSIYPSIVNIEHDVAWAAVSLAFTGKIVAQIPLHDWPFCKSLAMVQVLIKVAIASIFVRATWKVGQLEDVYRFGCEKCHPSLRHLYKEPQGYYMRR